MSNQQLFIHLDVHTQYSIQESKASIQRLVDKAIADGMRGMAVTDRGNMFGIKEFFNYVKNLKHKNPELDFTPILGCEICCAHNSMKSVTEDDTSNAGWSLILLAKNEVGYHNLVKIVSHAWIDGFHHRPYTDHTELEKYNEGIIACSSGLDGEVVDYILKGQLNKAEASALWFKQVFGDDFYLELQRNEVSQQVNEELVQFAHKHNIKIIGTSNIHFVDKDDAKTSCPLTNSDKGNNSQREWFMTQSEMNEIFADIPEALGNTLDVLSKIENYDIDNAPILPSFTTSAESDDSYLARLTYERAKAIYGDPLPDNIAERIERELHVIVSMGYSSYFLIVQDYVNMARNELDVWVGPGRGSAAGSLVNYCLGITHIDPIKYDLLFERFINSNRICLPDIDVDFDEDGRSKVLQYISDKYGAENVAHIITFNTSSIEKPQHSTNSFEPVKKSDSQIIGTDVHACGIVICGDSIENHVPIAALEAPWHPDKRLRCTQYDGCVIEETGLVKFDLLPFETLSVLKETVKNIKATLGIDVDLDNIDLQDAETFKLYCEGRTEGTFLFDSEGMQKYLRELQPNTFEDLIALHSLYRPGSMDYLTDIIDRKHNSESIDYEIPIMEKYLKNTYGLAIYQEQIMLLSQILANFTPDESDILYKALLKKKKEQLGQLKSKFVAQGSKNGHSQDSLEKVWANWEAYTYAFNKSHATCYTLLAFQTAYLKAHYPAEFSKVFKSSDKADEGAPVDSANADNIVERLRKAVEWFQKAAERGDANAQYNLGACYSNGVGVEQDCEKAVEWYRKAAEQGDACAQFALGICYYKGHGVEQDYEKAVEWFQKAAERGDANAQYNLGACYSNGEGVEQDCEKAVEWYRKAAEQGDACAQFALGICYYKGHGVEQDCEKAVKWFQKAAEQGNEYAIHTLAEARASNLCETLSTEETDEDLEDTQEDEFSKVLKSRENL